jgi:hypothetical protein
VVLASVGCRGGVRGWHERQQVRHEVVDRVSTWRRSSQKSLSPLTVSQIPIAVDMIAGDQSGFVAEFLAAHPTAEAEILPLVLSRFHTSLEERFTRANRLDPGPHPPLQNLREGCLIFFKTLGPRARAAIPDLLELLRRREAEEEFVDVSGRFFRNVLQSVMAESPRDLAGALQSPLAGVRAEICRVMGRLGAWADEFGPLLSERIEDVDDDVVYEALVSLSILKWSDEQAAERLRRRIGSLRTPWMRKPWEKHLELLEKHDAK